MTMLQLVQAEKHATDGKRGKTYNLFQAWENVQLVPSVGKLVTGAKRGKTCNRNQARESMQPVPSAGKHATIVVSSTGKRATGTKSEKKIQPVSSAGKRAAAVKRWEKCNRCQEQENARSSSDLLKTVSFDLLYLRSKYELF